MCYFSKSYSGVVKEIEEDKAVIAYKRCYVNVNGTFLPVVIPTGNWDGVKVGEPSKAKCYGTFLGHIGDSIPSLQCECGFHAFKKKTQVENSNWRIYSTVKVKLWGTVIEFPTGYRAQFQEIIHTCPPE